VKSASKVRTDKPLCVPITTQQFAGLVHPLRQEGGGGDVC